MREVRLIQVGGNYTCGFRKDKGDIWINLREIMSVSEFREIARFHTETPGTCGHWGYEIMSALETSILVLMGVMGQGKPSFLYYSQEGYVWEAKNGMFDQCKVWLPPVLRR